MIDLDYIRNFYPTHIANNINFRKHLIKEHIELMALDYLASTDHLRKLCFIGGTNLRLIKGIDRFSEDLDFDCKGIDEDEFLKITDDVITFFRRNGLNTEPRDKSNPNLTAFRRSIYFPELLFDLGLTGHREQRFLLKIEAQDQGVVYEPRMAQVARNGFVFQVPVPPDSTLLSMKLSALLSRAKGRDFYDTIFLWQQTEPDYTYLSTREGIADRESLISALEKKIATTDLEMKIRDFEHLLFNSANTERIRQFGHFIESRK